MVEVLWITLWLVPVFQIISTFEIGRFDESDHYPLYCNFALAIPMTNVQVKLEKF